MTRNKLRKRMTRTRWLDAVPCRWLLLSSWTLLAGCSGGAISESDMARYSLRNPPEEEESEQPTPPAPAKPVAQQAAPAKTVPVENLQDTHTVVERTSDASPPPSTAPLTDTRQPPAAPLSAEERTNQTVANLQRIAEAFQKHLDDKGYYPARAIHYGEDAHLSWRVALLPYLGYQQLYDEFRLDEPWNSRHNYDLLKKIPAVYQSPERFDDHTNYVAPVSSSSMFRGKGVVRPSDVEDGAKNTAMVVEADDVAAVPWTAPREYELDLNSPAKNLGTLRGDSFFLIWANAEVGRVLAATQPQQLKAMFTHDAGEDFSGGQIDQPLVASASRPAPRANLSGLPATQPSGQSTAPSVAVSPTDSASASLATEFAQRSSELLTLDEEGGAASYFYAAALANSSGGQWVPQYKWIPALRRPAAVIRFGIGLQFSGPQEAKLESLTSRTGSRAAPQARAWSLVTGELGQQLAEVLANHVAQHGSSALLSSTTNKPTKSGSATRRNLVRTNATSGMFAPGVQYLATARESALCKLARRENVDLLLLVDWRATARGWSASLSLVDVVRDVDVWKAPRIQSAQLERAKSNPLATNPVDETLAELHRFLETECIFVPIPDKLKPDHALRRITALAAEDDADEGAAPLRALAEMRLYHELGLVDAPQLLKAYQTKLGDEAGLQLLLGSADGKRQVLKTLLPAVPLVAENLRAAKLRNDATSDE